MILLEQQNKFKNQLDLSEDDVEPSKFSTGQSSINQTLRGEYEEFENVDTPNQTLRGEYEEFENVDTPITTNFP